MTIFHLPAVTPLTHRPRPAQASPYNDVRRGADVDLERPYSPSAQVRLVSACGRAGPIRARGVAAEQGLMFQLPRPTIDVCPGCAVLWDRAEEAGELLVAYTWNGRQQWAASTVMTMVPPRTRSTRSYTARGDKKDLRVTVFVRTGKAPKLMNTPKRDTSEPANPKETP